MHKQAKAESPALSSALQPGTLSTVSLNCDGEVKMGPGITLRLTIHLLLV